MPRALVTGAGGFLGPFLIRELLEEDVEVTALVRSDEKIPGCTTVKGDVTEPESIRSFFSRQDVVFHLAGKVSLLSREHAELYRVNVEGTTHVARLCKEFKVPKLIHASSVVAVGAGRSPHEILDENSPNLMRRFCFPNFESKCLAEEIALASPGELDVTVVNLSQVFGAGDAKKPPRYPNILAAKGKLRFFTEGGVSVVAAEDAASGMIAAWKKGKAGERYILGGENLTLKEILTLYAEMAGARPPGIKIPTALIRGLGRMTALPGISSLSLPLSLEGAYSSTLFHWFSHAKAERDLGFSARPARIAIENSFKWMKENGILERGESGSR
jgi:dihydroflavonol-4-reductase